MAYLAFPGFVLALVFVATGLPLAVVKVWQLLF